MTVTKRALIVTLTFPSGSTVVLNQDLNLRVRINKNVLALQNKAEIEIANMDNALRTQLLSQFTAWNKYLVTSGQASPNYVNVTVAAGYYDAATSQPRTGVVFKGQVALVDLVSPPPDIIVKLTCFTQQIDKSKTVTTMAPSQTSYKGYVNWAAAQMGLTPDCQTSYDNVIVTNPARSRYHVAQLIWDIQDYYKPNVAAFIDDDRVVVRDRNKLVNTAAITTVSQFVGLPTWYEWGVEFKTLMDITIKLAQGVTLNSKMNTAVNQTWIVTQLNYDLTSRDQAFYVTVHASPPA